MRRPSGGTASARGTKEQLARVVEKLQAREADVKVREDTAVEIEATNTEAAAAVTEREKDVMRREERVELDAIDVRASIGCRRDAAR